MDEGKSGSTPSGASYMGAGGNTPNANTNLDPSLQSGTTPADQQATQEIEQQHTQTEGLSTALTQQSDPARQMDNSGMLKPTGQGPDADLIGASGEDRQDDR
ncbi:hypothetical protein [Deinococcus sp. DB0503]|uniref:hypothetical protein n=1 Tax=Deinococcus sp. DB0503 TaxID=2479203 RepID=UPI0018DF5E58|nr:hypothetical protein [Deinococcus sp. DB0503]MBI0446123.1 hypothetical protein [Deinococcus sp. DB0503]